jgi:prevent-host-death family protein
MVAYSLSQARVHLDALVRRAASERKRATITDHGRPVAVLMNAEELADLEEALGLAEFRARQAAGDHYTIPHAEVRKKLGVRRHGRGADGRGRPST